MFFTIKLILIILGIYLIIRGIQKKSNAHKAIGAGTVIVSLLAFWFLDFWGEKLWFDALGYNKRFWTVVFTKAGFVVGGGLFAGLFTMLLLSSIPKSRKGVKWLGVLASIFIGALWGFANWNTFLKFWFSVEGKMADPIFQLNEAFYLFDLPFYDQVVGIFQFLSYLALAVSFVALFVVYEDKSNIKFGKPSIEFEKKHFTSLFVSAGVILLLWAVGYYLDRFRLMYSDYGVVNGPGSTDLQIKLPILNIATGLTIILSIVLFVPKLRNYFLMLIGRREDIMARFYLSIVYVFVLSGLIYVLGLGAVPYLFQQYRVEPNEITFEKEYIKNNIAFTKNAFNLGSVEEKEFKAEERFSRNLVEENQSIFDNIRLWDWRALDAVLKQFQEIRLYYEFKDVDIDRYRYNGEYKQVMVSAREMEVENLPENSQTFVNKRFKYTHGHGMALSTVSDFTEEGLPNFLVKDIPPKTKFEQLAVDKPQIYYGELTDDYVIVNSSEKEFDYPSGDKNIYTSYEGEGGVGISNFFRKLVYSYKLGGTQLLLSSYPDKESRIMYKREITNRIKTLAPFLKLDNDPYIVNADGELYWMVDAYTTSSYYPYSEPFPRTERIEYKKGEVESELRIRHDRFAGVNYIRNSVKVAVNAYNGEVDFYIFDDNDPIIQVWNRIFPDLFQTRADMPQSLENHIRYPADLLLIQGLVFSKYHMEDPEVFYNQEDLWIRATEKYYSDIIPVEPYYIMWELPDANQSEFSLILPFTPKNRQVLIGWIAGLCDPENYGRLMAYNFPKEKRVLGTQQVETKIDQDSYLSGQLSLWDQRGSEVIRGNVLAIPIGNTLIYVEPIYLQAETAAYPELRLVCVMHGDKLSYAETFDEALKGIFDDTRDQPVIAGGEQSIPKIDTNIENTIKQANEAFNNYLNATGDGNFNEASEELKRLKSLLERLSNKYEKPSSEI